MSAVQRLMRHRAVRDDGRMLQISRALGVSRATLWALRTELESTWVGVRRVLWPPALLEWRALRGQRDLLLNVASGPHVLDGFVNLELRAYHPDIFRWDCRRSVPAADGCCRGIRIEHFLEHLDPRDEAPDLLRDCHRALAPGHVLRIVVPDTARYLAAYVERSRAALDELAVDDPLPDDLPTPLDVINHVFHQWHEHRWAYDVENLTWRLREAGFVEITISAFGMSRLPELGRDRDEHAAYSLYVDCIKPTAANIQT
jgi:predicted SAM-dependent methyltransferase